MKRILNLMRFLGVLMIIGTAGASDCLIIDFSQAVSQVMGGILLILAPNLVSYVWRLLVRTAMAIFCIR